MDECAYELWAVIIIINFEGIQWQNKWNKFLIMQSDRAREPEAKKK